MARVYEWLRHVLPRLSRGDLANGSHGDEHPQRDGGVGLPRRASLPYLTHMILSELRLPGVRVGIPNVPLAAFRDHVSNVVSLRPEEQVIGSVARRIIAPMEDGHSLRDRPIVQCPRQPMGEPQAVAVLPVPDRPIAEFRSAARPTPASVIVLDDFRPEAIFKRSGGRGDGGIGIRVPMVAPTLPMRGAEGSRSHGATAVGNRAEDGELVFSRHGSIVAQRVMP